MSEKPKPTSIALQEKELKLIDEYGKKFGLGRSATIRVIVNNFFLKNKEVKS